MVASVLGQPIILGYLMGGSVIGPGGLKVFFFKGFETIILVIFDNLC